MLPLGYGYTDPHLCGDGFTTIESDSICDFQKDCPDGDDERNCPGSSRFSIEGPFTLVVTRELSRELFTK